MPYYPPSNNTPPPATASSAWVYGDGSDDAVVVGPGETLVLEQDGNARDYYCASLTIDATGTLDTNGCRLFCQTPIQNEGLIVLAPIVASGQVTPGESVGGTLPGGSGAGAVGGFGGNEDGSGSEGGSKEAWWPGAVGLAGGNGGGVNGGTGGLLTAPVAGWANGTINNAITALQWFPLGQASQQVVWGGGGGGGEGGALGSGDVGGAGGGPGGIIVIAAPSISGAGTIRSRGGNGAGGTGVLATRGGGGGGGLGGLIVLITDYGATSVDNTTDVAGGVGAGLEGKAGGNGADGQVRHFAIVS